MGLVVRRAGVLAVPARGEGELEADAIDAVGIQERLVGQVVAEQSALVVPCGVVKAVEAESALGKDFLGGLAVTSPLRLRGVGLRDVKSSYRIVAASAVACDHAEVVGKRRDISARVPGVGVQKVVAEQWLAHVVLKKSEHGDPRKHAADLLNLLVGAICVLEVEDGCPVGGLVLGHGARGAVGTDQVLVGRRFTEACRENRVRKKRPRMLCEARWEYSPEEP